MAKPKRKQSSGRNTNGGRDPGRHKPNFWGMMRDVLIASMNKGVFLIACIFFIFVIIIMRLESDALLSFLNALLDKLSDWSVTGWVLFALVVITWWWQARMARKNHHHEIARMAREKKNLQEQLLNVNLGSSDG